MNVALIIFNRPDLTGRVFAEIAKSKPSKLLVIADGPRPDRPDDVAKCAAARAIIDRVDWDCDVIKNYSDDNLGCGRRPATGITWVFEQVTSAIILEDDCVPHPSFFRFCDELLSKYERDERVVQISGNFHQFGYKRGQGSYFFSRWNVCAGGFATWRRAWRHFDMSISDWPRLRETSWLEHAAGERRAAEFWRPVFDQIHAAKGEIDIWDFQWVFACMVQNGLSIIPNTGLLSNLGFRPDGTHTRKPSRWANLPVAEMTFPLRHPPYVMADAKADHHFTEHVLLKTDPRPLFRRLQASTESLLLSAVRSIGAWFSAILVF
jgi:hypothetical protein